MTTTQITGGSVKYTEPSNYSTGKTGCEVTIHFTVAEGAEFATWQMIGTMARQEAVRLATGQAAPLAQPSVPAASPATTTAQPQPTPVATGAPIIGAASTVIGQPEAIGTSPGPIARTPASLSEVVIGAPPIIQGAGVVSPDVSASPAASATTASPSGGVIIGHSNGAAGITDRDLRDAVQERMKQLSGGEDADPIARQRGPVMVGKLLTSFGVMPPGKIYALSQDQRVPFLEKLAALT